MKWYLKRFEELSSCELYEILRLRCEVFVVEQSCAYPDIDGRDPSSFHLFAENQKGDICAYLRVLDRGQTFAERSIGRVLVRKEFRGHGLARELLRRAIRLIESDSGGEPVRIEAQAYLQEFYREAGFVPCSGIFLEDGIPHLEMLYSGEKKRVPEGVRGAAER